MDYQTSKIILWAMLCFPILVIGIYMIFKLMDDIIIINRVKKQKNRAGFPHHSQWRLTMKEKRWKKGMDTQQESEMHF